MIRSFYLFPKSLTSSFVLIMSHSFATAFQSLLPLITDFFLRNVLSTQALLSPLTVQLVPGSLPISPKMSMIIPFFSRLMASSPLKSHTLVLYAVTPAASVSLADVYLSTNIPPAARTEGPPNVFNLTWEEDVPEPFL